MNAVVADYSQLLISLALSFVCAQRSPFLADI